VEIFSPIETIFRRNNWFISRKINDEWEKRYAKMTGDGFLEVSFRAVQGYLAK